MSILRHATKAEQDAAVKSAHNNIAHLIDLFMGTWPASMYRNTAVEKLESPEGRAQLLKIVDDALDAAEAVREAAELEHVPILP